MILAAHSYGGIQMGQPDNELPEPEPLVFTDAPEFIKPDHLADAGPSLARPKKPRGPVGRAFLGPEKPTKPARMPRLPTLGKRGQFEKPLTEIYISIGTLVLPFDPVCGQTFIQQAPACAKSLDELAYQNEAVRKALEYFVATSVWGAVIAAHLPILLAVAMHHSSKIQDRMAAGLGDAVEQMIKNNGQVKNDEP
jgi:hypothetical protein